MNCNLSVLIPRIRYYSYLDPNHPTAMESECTITLSSSLILSLPFILIIIYYFFLISNLLQSYLFVTSYGFVML